MKNATRSSKYMQLCECASLSTHSATNQINIGEYLNNGSILLKEYFMHL